jgi:hypothetical protein
MLVAGCGCLAAVRLLAGWDGKLLWPDETDNAAGDEVRAG